MLNLSQPDGVAANFSEAYQKFLSSYAKKIVKIDNMTEYPIDVASTNMDAYNRNLMIGASFSNILSPSDNFSYVKVTIKKKSKCLKTCKNLCSMQ